MEKIKAINSFQGGLNRDSLKSLSDASTYRYARNAVNGTSNELGFGLTNEEANELCVSIENQVGAYHLPATNETLVFTEEGEFHVVDNDNCTSKLAFSDSEFDCDFKMGDCEWHDIEVRYEDNDCNDRYVYFSSKCTYYWFNLDEMLNEDRKSGLKKSLECEGCLTGCEYFKVFNCTCAPKITTDSNQSSDVGALKSGSYRFVVRLINRDGGWTNWFHLSDQVNIGSAHNVAGEPTGGHIEVSIGCLDCKYNTLELAVIETIGGSKSAKSLGRLDYSNGMASYTYYGGEGEPIDVTELLVPDTTYPKGKYLEQKDGTMLYYGIKQEANINFQPIANEIEVEVVEYELPYETVKKYDIKSFMRGETYAFAIKPNRCDGRETYYHHIQATGTVTQSDGSTTSFSDTVVPTSDGIADVSDILTFTQEQELIRSREPKPDSPHEPQLDAYAAEVETLIDSFETEIVDICPCLTCGDDHCINDLGIIDSIVKKWGATLAAMGQDEFERVLDPTNIKDAAAAIMDSIRNRERISRVADKFTVTAPSNDYGGGGGTGTTGTSSLTDDVPPTEESPFGKESIRSDNYHDCAGIPNKGIWFKQTNSWPTTPKEEESVKLPCSVDCNGEFLFGDLADKAVAHHTFPTADISVPFRAMNVGVPSKYISGSDEYSDSYVRILGVRFKNINIPDDVMEDLCEDRPYTIGMVKRTDINKSILFKGVAFDTFTVNNSGKIFDQPRHAANSHIEVSRYANNPNNTEYPRLMNEGSGTSHVVFSLDALTRYPALNADKVRRELIYSGSLGATHGMYAKGEEPADTVKGSRVDQRGTRQALNMNKADPAYIEGDIDFKIYAPANSTVAPPAGNSNRPLMNKHQQASVWVKSGVLEHKTDESFTGQVIQHNYPIFRHETDYVSFVRSMDNQYGQVDSAVYIPILHAGKSNKNEIEGAVGDVYVGPWSFVRTSYVSDRVGSCEEDKKFKIGEEVTGKKDRCICDQPDDTLIAQNGLWVWNTLPESGDKADPKNWAGCQTVNNTELRTAQEARTLPASSDYYYPKTLTTLITVWGEHEVCPWLRQKSDILPQQWYPEINPLFQLDSGWDFNSDTPWENSFLNQFYFEDVQPSLWKRGLKALIRTMVNVAFAYFGIESILDIDSALDVVGGMVEFPIIAAGWLLISQVLFTNDKIDKLLGIPPCKSDDQGGEGDGNIKKFFTNFLNFNWDYLPNTTLEYGYSMPNPYNTCDCEDCLNGEHTNEIFYSDPQIKGSSFDSYKHVRPNNKINIKAAYGKLTNIFSVGPALYAHTTDTMWQLRYGLTSLPSDLGSIRIGPGTYLSNPISMSEGVPEGVAGLRYKNAAINTHYGYFFVDSDANKIYRFDGKLEEISGQGMFNFFKEHLSFCNETECVDQRVSGSNYYALGIDPRHNRFLFTKSDGDDSYTLSYDVAEKKWISFHDYTPQNYLWDRDNMFSTNSSGTWVHNKEGVYQTYYGETFPYTIEFSSVPRDVEAFKYTSSIISTEASEMDSVGSWIEDLDKTFNKVAVYNSTQGTGTLILEWWGDNKGDKESMHEGILEKSQIVKATKSNRVWRVNGFKDFRKKDCLDQPMIIQTSCNPIGTINEGIFDCTSVNKQDYYGKIISDKYLMYRLTYDHDNKTNLKTLYVKTLGDDQTKKG